MRSLGILDLVLDIMDYGSKGVGVNIINEVRVEERGLKDLQPKMIVIFVLLVH